MKRIWHPYHKWEEYHGGMWRRVTPEERDALLPGAIRFTGDHEVYGAAMLRVAREWRYSCEHNLTDSSLNRRAWIGHAAACLAIACPESVTRAAWWHLTQQQQDDANAAADRAIAAWESLHIHLRANPGAEVWTGGGQ